MYDEEPTIPNTSEPPPYIQGDPNIRHTSTHYSAPIMLFGKNAKIVPTIARTEEVVIRK